MCHRFQKLAQEVALYGALKFRGRWKPMSRDRPIAMSV